MCSVWGLGVSHTKIFRYVDRVGWRFGWESVMELEGVLFSQHIEYAFLAIP